MPGAGSRHTLPWSLVRTTESVRSDYLQSPRARGASPLASAHLITEGVGRAANSAVVIASVLIFVIDLIAVQITEFLGLI
jgi:hypothetical protein